MQHLPLREDFDENEAVFRCIATLYQQGHPAVVKMLPTIISVAAGVLHNKQTSNKGNIVTYMELVNYHIVYIDCFKLLQIPKY